MASEGKSKFEMLMEDSQLQMLADILRNREESLAHDIESGSERDKNIKESKEAHLKVTTLLKKCKDLNRKTNQGSESSNTCNDLSDIDDKTEEEFKIVKADTKEDRHDYLTQAIDIIMDHVKNWCNLNEWTGLFENLELESKVLFEKYINLRKRYTYDFNHNPNKKGSNLAKADDVAKEIQVEFATEIQLGTKLDYGVPEFAADIQVYVKYALNVSLQCAQNCCLRSKWISKIEAHFEMLDQELDDQNVLKQNNMQGMAEHLSLYKQCMEEFVGNCRRGSIPDDSNTAYSKLLNKEQIQFSEMATKRKMNELGFAGEFDNLAESQKLKVWRGIINESGRADMSDLECAERRSNLAVSESGSSDCLLVNFIFGKGDDIIREFTKPFFHGAYMPDGMLIGRQVIANQKKPKKK